jgi:hypothetical protein
MSRTVTLVLAALALTAVTGCDEMIQRATTQQLGPTSLQDDAGPTDKDGECVTCAKFRARPPAGVNIPPSL